MTRMLLVRILSYAKPYRWHILGLLCSILLTTGMGLLVPLIFRDLIDHTLPNHEAARLNLLALSLVLIYVLDSIIRIGQRKLNSTISEGVVYDLRVALFRHLRRMSLRFFTNTRTGELMSRLNNDVRGAESAISETGISIITNIIQAIGTLIMMIAMEWRLTIIGILVLPLITLAAKRSRELLREISQQAMDYNAHMNALMYETLNVGGALLVRLFGRSQAETERFQNRAATVRDLHIRQAIVSSQFFTIVGFVGMVGTVLVYWIGGHLVLKGIFTVGTIVAFSWYLSNLYGSLQGLANVRIALTMAIVSFERVFEILDLPVEIEEKKDAIYLSCGRGELVFDRVFFQYPRGEQNLLQHVERHGIMESVQNVFPMDDEQIVIRDSHECGMSPSEKHGTSQARQMALEDISFIVQPGQLVALVGASGAGKTTLTYLIPRLYDPTSGRVMLDGYDIRSISLSTLAGQIGMVTQNTYLLHDTIRANLAYAKLDATTSEIETAASAANIHGFVVDLPDGYDTVVGEHGYRLSGGEKQRIALARVILKNPRILVLDEATNQLDGQSEALIQEALKSLMTTHTTIVIAHRLNTVLAADEILVMDRGRIVERGTHHYLMSCGGKYVELYNGQFNQA